jgi:hypothetical protein
MRFLTLALLACNGDKTTPATGQTGDTGSTSVQTYEPTWDGVQQLFVDHCDRCHPSVNYVDLHDPYTLMYYVVPGDPDNSVLWQVLAVDPLPPTLEPMPQDTGRLPLATVDHVRVWIENGAATE